MSADLRVLLFDVETAPLLSHVWRLDDRYVNPDGVLHDSFMLTWAAKWEGQRGVRSDRLSGREAKAQDDSRIIQGLADTIRRADVVVAHNIDRFDLPVVNTRLLKLGLEPLPPVKTIDTLRLAKSNFRLASNKLDYLAGSLGLEGKDPTTFDLWRSAYQGDEAALRHMLRYNKQDVRVLEGVYQALKPYAKGVPRLVDADEPDERVCPFCGEDTLQSRGYHRTNASTFRRFQCQACSKWSRARRSEPERVSVVGVG